MAQQAKAEHKIKYPDYRFKPVHNKSKAAKEQGKNTVYTTNQ
jgi:hypothetical protein